MSSAVTLLEPWGKDVGVSVGVDEGAAARLRGLGFTITDDLHEHVDRNEPLDVKALGSQLANELQHRQIFDALPDWATSRPLPLRRPARHFEPAFDAVSDRAFDALVPLLGSTIESVQRFQAQGSDGEVRSYHRVMTKPRKIEIEWKETVPPMDNIDTDSSMAMRSEWRRRHREQRITTVLALYDEHAESTELLRLTPLSMYPLVTDHFAHAWSNTGIARRSTDTRDGPYYLQIVTQRVDYRWIPKTAGA